MKRKFLIKINSERTITELVRLYSYCNNNDIRVSIDNIVLSQENNQVGVVGTITAIPFQFLWIDFIWQLYHVEVVAVQERPDFFEDRVLLAADNCELCGQVFELLNRRRLQNAA